MRIAGDPGNWYKIAKLAQTAENSTTTINRKVPLILKIRRVTFSPPRKSPERLAIPAEDRLHRRRPP
jgi:hypothetical protein